MLPIRRSREIVVMILVSVAMLITGVVVGLEVAAYPEESTSVWVGRLGMARSVVAFLVVLLIGSHGLGRSDRRWLTLAFVGVLGGDLFLVLLNIAMPGIAIFVVVHCLLIVRHSRGLRAALSGPRRARTIFALIVTAALVYGGSALVLWEIWDILAAKGNLVVDCVYLAVLATSLFMAATTLSRRTFPRLNAWMTAIGVLCFFACDVEVGVELALSGTPAGAMVAILVNFAYTPALLLLGLSGYCWSERALAEIA